MVGFEGRPASAPDHDAAQVFAAAAGGGMSSRLFQEVREKRGLAYSIYGFHWDFIDTGLFGFYAGSRRPRCGGGGRGVARLPWEAAHGLDESEIRRAKAQMKVSLVTALEQPGARVHQLSRQMQIYGRPLSFDEMLARVDAITVEEVRKTGAAMLRSPPAVAVIGAVGKVPGRAKIAARIERGMMALFGLTRPVSPEPVLRGDGLYLRPAALADYSSWSRLRAASRSFLEPWEPTWPDDDLTRAAFRRRLKRQDDDMARDEAYSFLIFDSIADELLGGITLGGVRRGVSQSGTLGYWMGAPHAGKGRMTRAVAATVEFALIEVAAAPDRSGLHPGKCAIDRAASNATGFSARATREASSGSTGLGATMSCSGWSKATRVRDWRGPILTEQILNNRLRRQSRAGLREAGRAKRASGAWRGLIGVVLLLAALTAFCRPAFAVQSVRVSPDSDAIDLTRAVERYSAQGDRIQVSTAPGADGIVRRIEVSALEPGAQPAWIVFALTNDSEEQLTRLIVAPHFRFVGSGLIWPDLGSSRITTITASQGAAPEREDSADADVFRLTLDPGTTVTYVAELRTPNLPQLYLWEPDAFKDKSASLTLYEGILIGIAGLLALFLTIVFVVRGAMIFPAAAALAWAVFAYVCIDFGFWRKMFGLGDASEKIWRAGVEATIGATLIIFLFAYLNLRRWHVRYTHFAFAWLVLMAAVVGLVGLQSAGRGGGGAESPSPPSPASDSCSS